MNIKDLLIDWNQKKWEEKNREMYQATDKNQWPWFSETLDEDILAIIQKVASSDAKILDLGTCSGAQAIALARLGYSVIGSDISETALAKAEAALTKESNLDIAFVLDDITHSKFEAGQFDIILDRGCFHSICCFAGLEYAKEVQRILAPNGLLLLKTMSAKEERFVDYNTIGNQKIPMPYHFEERQIRESLSDFFDIESINDSYFYSDVVNPPAKALLSLLRPK